MCAPSKTSKLDFTSVSYQSLSVSLSVVCVCVCSKPTPIHSNKNPKIATGEEGSACWGHCCLRYRMHRGNSPIYWHTFVHTHTHWIDSLRPKPLQLALEWKQWRPRATLNSSDYGFCRQDFLFHTFFLSVFACSIFAVRLFWLWKNFQNKLLNWNSWVWGSFYRGELNFRKDTTDSGNF